MDNKPGKIILKLFGISLIAVVVVTLLLYVTNNTDKLLGILSGYVFSLILFLFGFISISWALKKPLKTLIGIVLGGMFLRFVLIGVAIFVILKYTEINILIFVVSFFLFYLIYQFFEIRFINATIFKGKK